MNLKNYTTEVTAAKSIDAIERLLIDFGATNIMKEYSADRKIESISFIVECKDMKLPFRLPAKTKAIYKWLKKKRPNTQEKTLMEQAERICWKQMWEWIYINLCLIELEQVEKLEALFPYLYDVQARQTWFEKTAKENFKALLPANN